MSSDPARPSFAVPEPGAPAPVVAGSAGPAGLRAQCTGCGRVGASRAEVADLQLVWLIRDPAGRVALARFHQRCAPAAGAVEDYACTICGDGPLLSGELAAADDLVTAAEIDSWMRWEGWDLTLPACPDCARVCRPRPRDQHRPAT